MFDKFPLLPVALTAGLMAGDGLVASYDIDAWAKKNAGSTTPVAAGSSPPLTHSWALKYQAGIVAAGVVAELMHAHPDVSESLLVAGTGLIAREVAVHFAQSRQTTPATTQGYSRPVAAPAAARALAARPAVVGGGRDSLLTQAPTLAG